MADTFGGNTGSPVPQSGNQPVNPVYNPVSNPTGTQAPANYTNPNSSITSSSLTPQSPITPVQPNVPPLPAIPAAPVTPPLTETGQQAKMSDLSTQLQDLNTQLEGRSAAQTAAENAQGLPALEQTVQDLTARATALSDQANQIPLIDQQNAQGRGITAAGLAPIDTGNLRNNAIEALSVHSLLAAAQGNVTYAQSLADKAVAAQFDPIQAQIDALTKNLQLIQNDPQTTIEEKNQAQAQLDNVNAQQAQIDQQKADAQAVAKVAVSAAQNINTFTPTTDYPTASQAIQAIQNAPNEAAATAIAAKTGLVAPAKLNTTIQDIGGRKVQIVTDDQGNIVRQTDLGSSATYSELHPTTTKNPAGYTSFTPTQQLDLQKAGETAASITQLEKDINQYGPQYVLDNGQGLSEATKQWLENTYGISSTQASGTKNGLFGLGFLGL